MRPETAKAWIGIARDLATVCIGVLMLVYETVSDNPNAYIIGAGLAALGLPPVLRLDSKRRNPDDEET